MRSLMAALLMFIQWQTLSFAQAQEDYGTTVYGSSFSSTNRVVIEEKEIQESKAPNLTTLLSTQANLNVTNSSFQPSAIYLRGGDASHILILVDGLPFFDPASQNRSFNLNQLDIKSIRRIEISKGAQTVLYGGQALAGVIKIETFPKEFSSENHLNLEAGQRSYHKASAVLTRDLQNNRLLVGRGQFSEKMNRSPVLGSELGYPTQNVSAEIGGIQSGDSDVFFKVSRFQDTTKIGFADFRTYQALDTADFNTATNISSLSVGYRGKNSAFKPSAVFGYQKTDRNYQYLTAPPCPAPPAPPTSGCADPTDDKYFGDLINARFEMIPWDHEFAQIRTGLSFQKEQMIHRNIEDLEVTNSSNDLFGVFLKGDFQARPGLEFEAGVRHEEARYKDRIQTYQLGITFWDNTKFEYATGFKLPSLFQLYGEGGNPELLPETSQTFSLNHDFVISERQKFSVSVFESQFKNLVTSQVTGGVRTLVNVGRANSRGAEAQYGFAYSNETGLRLNLGYQEPRDLENSRWLIRRPLKTGSLALHHSVGSERFLYELIATGDRLDRLSTTQYDFLKPYVISNFKWTHEIDSSTSFYIRGNNIWNERFEESRGYFNEGVFWLAGVELML